MKIMTDNSNFYNAALRHGILPIARAIGTTPDDIAVPNILNAAAVEFANIGFLVDPTQLSGITITELVYALDAARVIIGADRSMEPIYPGFPQQVENLDTLTLLTEQIVHYITAGAFLPNYPTIQRNGLSLEDMCRRARKLEVKTSADAAMGFIHTLTASKIALSQADRELLAESVKMNTPTLETVEKVLQNARNGENTQTLLLALKKVNTYSNTQLFEIFSKTSDNSDHLLRVVLALYTAPSSERCASKYHEAIVNMSKNAHRLLKMTKMPKNVRRSLVSRFAELSTDFKADRAVAKMALWRMVFRCVHPYDFNLNDSQKRIVDIVHENVEYRSFNSLVEEAFEKKNTTEIVNLLSSNQPGNLLRRLVSILRTANSTEQVEHLCSAVEKIGAGSPLTTLISVYNGVLSCNDSHTRVTRVAGLNNTMIDRKDIVTVPTSFVDEVLKSLRVCLREALRGAPAPKASVGVMSDMKISLVDRDASSTDRVMSRWMKLAPMGNGDILRVFGHWRNNKSTQGYMDVGVVILDDNFEHLGSVTWNSWMGSRNWAVYSGDKLVYPGDSAAEFIDLKLDALRSESPKAKWAAMTVQSWSGWKMNTVDFLAGVMLRSDLGRRGEVFDARTVETAFKPTTKSTQAVPLVVNVETGEVFWIDSSNGSTAACNSAATDSTVGSIVYDELIRPRLTYGELAELWAEAHNMETTNDPVDIDLIDKLFS